MFPKILVAVLAFTANFIIVWYGNFTGKLSSKGSFFGLNYDSIFVRAVITQFQFVWVLIIANIMFSLFFKLGFESFKNNFLTMAIIWFSMGPLSALVFNAVVLKEKVTFVALIGVAFIVIGSIFVVAQKEILAFINRI